MNISAGKAVGVSTLGQKKGGAPVKRPRGLLTTLQVCKILKRASQGHHRSHSRGEIKKEAKEERQQEGRRDETRGGSEKDPTHCRNVVPNLRNRTSQSLPLSIYTLGAGSVCMWGGTAALKGPMWHLPLDRKQHLAHDDKPQSNTSQ